MGCKTTAHKLLACFLQKHPPSILGEKMSIVRCEICEVNIDTDYDEYYIKNDIQVCEDCTPIGRKDDFEI